MTLQQLKYAVVVAEKGSINEAAKKLYISQPSLSNAIRELEIEIGKEIFLRTNKGVVPSLEGKEFLSYAFQVVEQAKILEAHYLGTPNQKRSFGVSTQHYIFAVEAFLKLMGEFNQDEFNFKFRETTVTEVISDVKKRKSEVGLLYMNQFNETSILKQLESSELEFNELFQSNSYVLVTSTHPLAKKNIIKVKDLKSYIYLSFGKGEYNSHYFMEEMPNIFEHSKNIEISDRSTLFYLLRKLNGFTICTSMVSKELHGNDIVPIPLDVTSQIKVGVVMCKKNGLSSIGKRYIELLKKSLECWL